MTITGAMYAFNTWPLISHSLLPLIALHIDKASAHQPRGRNPDTLSEQKLRMYIIFQAI